MNCWICPLRNLRSPDLPQILGLRLCITVRICNVSIYCPATQYHDAEKPIMHYACNVLNDFQPDNQSVIHRLCLNGHINNVA